MRHLFFNINITSGKWAGVACSIRKSTYIYLKAKIYTNFFYYLHSCKKQNRPYFIKTSSELYSYENRSSSKLYKKNFFSCLPKQKFLKNFLYSPKKSFRYFYIWQLS